MWEFGQELGEGASPLPGNSVPLTPLAQKAYRSLAGRRQQQLVCLGEGGLPQVQLEGKPGTLGQRLRFIRGIFRVSERWAAGSPPFHPSLNVLFCPGPNTAKKCGPFFLIYLPSPGDSWHPYLAPPL